MRRLSVYSLFLIVLLALAPTLHELAHADDHYDSSITTPECVVCDQLETVTAAVSAATERQLTSIVVSPRPLADEVVACSYYLARAPPFVYS